MARRQDETDDDVGSKPAVVRRMLRNYKLSAEAESANRDSAVLAIKFAQGEQWQADILQDRDTFNLPSEVYNQIPQFVHQVTNDLRQNMPQTSFIPADDSDKEKAEIREDLVRSIQTASEGEVAYDTAASSAVVGGWGYWRYLTAYENEKTFDQIIKCGWIPNPMSVYDDPNSTQQDRLDRNFLIHVYDEDKEDFNNGNNTDINGKDITYSDSDLQGIGNDAPDWAGNGKVRVAEYWERTIETKKLYRTKSGTISETKPKGEHDERDVETWKVTWYKCTANHVIEKRDWLGIYIPYVFVSGEASLIDGKWIYSGLVHQMMGAQRQYNYWMNTATYMASLAGKNQYIGDKNAFAGHEHLWQDANIVPRAYLPYNSVDEFGNAIPMPQRSNNSVDLSAMVNLIQAADQNFYKVTGIYPASLGQSSNEKSGKAILARQREGDTSTYHYGDNVARSLRAGGRILDDLIAKVYDGARTIKGVKEDGQTRDIKINQKFKDKDGTQKEYDMTQSGYGVVVSTGPAYTTKRQEMADAMNQLAPALIGAYPAVGPEWVRSQDWPGADGIAEAMERSLPPNLQKPVEEEGLPPKAAQQIQQMGQIIEQLQGQLQQAAQELQANQADIQTKQAELQLKAQDQQGKQAYDAAKLQLDARKLDLDEQKMQLEMMQAHLQGLQTDIQARQPQMMTGTAPDEEGEEDMPMPTDPMGIQQQIDMLTAKKQELEERDAMDQQRQMMDMQRQQDEQMERQMLLQTLIGIKAGVDALTMSIMAPKRVVRGPDGAAVGVETVDTMGNA